MAHQPEEGPGHLEREADPVPDPATLVSLVEAARRGDEGAWRELYLRLTPRLLAEARRYRLGPADVDEVVQGTWVRCFERLGGIRSASALPAWLLVTCRNQAVGVLRERRRCLPTELVLEPSAREDGASGGPLDDLLAGEEQDALVVALRDLPRRQQVVVTALLAADATGCSYQRVAEDLAMPIGSIGPTRQRAVATLRRRLQPASGPPAPTRTSVAISSPS